MVLFFGAALAVVGVAWWLAGGALALDGEESTLEAEVEAKTASSTEGATQGATKAVDRGPGSNASSSQESSRPRPDTGGPPPRAASVGNPKPEAVLPATSVPVPPMPRPAVGSAPRVAVVIDDLGRSLEDVRRLAALGVPVTYAVLPFETLTPEVVAEVEAVGGELLLHLPMEGRDGANPGPGALRMGMPGGELRAATRDALAAVPGAVGVNNHMGSVLSADAASMRAVLGEIAGRDIFFLDSRTTAESIAFPAARNLGIPAAERDVFLDGQRTGPEIRRQFRRALDIARTQGSAIAIGHPHAITLSVLESEIPQARDAGYRFVPVSSLLR